MSVKSEIVNEALTLLKQPHSTGEDDTNPHPRRVYSMFDQRARLMLEQYNWKFAKAVTQLAASEPTPAAWKYGFPKPGDCLRIVQVDSRADMEERVGIQYDVQEGRILTDSDVTWLLYISSAAISNLGRWSASARTALAHDLAALVAPALDTTRSEREMLHMLADRAMRRARHQDSQDGPMEVQPMSRWQSAALTHTAGSGGWKHG